MKKGRLKRRDSGKLSRWARQGMFKREYEKKLGKETHWEKG